MKLSMNDLSSKGNGNKGEKKRTRKDSIAHKKETSRKAEEFIALPVFAEKWDLAVFWKGGNPFLLLSEIQTATFKLDEDSSGRREREREDA